MPRNDCFGREVDALPIVQLPFSGFESKILADLEYFMNLSIHPLTQELERWQRLMSRLAQQLSWAMSQHAPREEQAGPRTQRLYLLQISINDILQEAWDMMLTQCLSYCYPALFRLLLPSNITQTFEFWPDAFAVKEKYTKIPIDNKLGKASTAAGVSKENKNGYAARIYATADRVIEEFDRLWNVLLDIEMAANCNDLQQWKKMPRWVHYLHVWQGLFGFIISQLGAENLVLAKWRFQVNEWILNSCKNK